MVEAVRSEEIDAGVTGLVMGHYSRENSVSRFAITMRSDVDAIPVTRDDSQYFHDGYEVELDFEEDEMRVIRTKSCWPDGGRLRPEKTLPLEGRVERLAVHIDEGFKINELGYDDPVPEEFARLLYDTFYGN